MLSMCCSPMPSPETLWFWSSRVHIEIAPARALGDSFPRLSPVHLWPLEGPWSRDMSVGCQGRVMAVFRVFSKVVDCGEAGPP
jgi:hypothetical protein